MPVLYCSTFLGADQASYDNKILFSGVMSSVALMLLIWTYMYTLEHEGDVSTLSSILTSSMGGSQSDPSSIVEGDAMGGDAAADTQPPPVAEESEF